MPRFPKPFFRAARGLWYVQLAGRQINLGPNRERAFERYHVLMGRHGAPYSRSNQTNSQLVVVLIDTFLEHCQLHNSSATYRWYRDRLQDFVPKISLSLTVGELRPFHVQQWVDSHPCWSNGTRRIAIRAIKRVIRRPTHRRRAAAWRPRSDDEGAAALSAGAGAPDKTDEVEAGFRAIGRAVAGEGPRCRSPASHSKKAPSRLLMERCAKC